MRIIFLETRVVTEEIARERLIHPAETEIMLHAFAFHRLADETGTLRALYRFEGIAMVAEGLAGVMVLSIRNCLRVGE